MRQPDVTQNLLKQGVEVITSTPDEFAQFIKSEIAKFARVVAASSAQFE